MSNHTVSPTASNSIWDYFIYSGATSNGVAADTTRGQINYSYSTAQPFAVYPDNTTVNIFGPLFLPRVYGKDLSAFEIAATGKVAMTLGDVHSFDFTRCNATSNISIVTQLTDSFNIRTSNCSMYFDGSNGNALLSATSNITLSAPYINLSMSNLDILANNLSLTAYSNVYISGSNGVNIFSSSNASISVSSNNNWNVNLFAASNVIASASSKFLANGYNTLNLIGSQSNVSLLMTGNKYSVTSTSDITETSSGGSFNAIGYTTLNLVGSASNASLTMANDNVFVAATSNIADTAGGSYTATGVGSLTLIGSQSNVSLAMANSNLTIVSTKNISETAATTFSATGTVNVALAGSAGTATIGLSNQSLLLYSASNMVSGTSNQYVVTAASNMSLSTTNGTVFIGSASNSTSLSMANNNANLTASNGNILVESWSNVTLNGHSNVLIMSAQSNDYILLNNGGLSNIDIYSINKVNMSASNLMAFTALSNFTVVSGGSNSSLTMDNSSNVALLANHNVTVSGLSNVYLKTTVNSINIIDTGNTSTQVFTVAGKNVMTLNSNNLILNGDLQINGIIDSTFTNVSVNNLSVQDSSITLCTQSNGVLLDSSGINDKSGFLISGSNSLGGSWTGSNSPGEKSLLWNSLGATCDMSNLGTSNATQEPFWELKGGAFYITAEKPTNSILTGSVMGSNVSFGFRINDYDELEIVKKYTFSNATTAASNYTKKIARFGRVLF